MHGNGTEVEEILEKTFGLCIHFLHIIEGTLGNSSVEKRDLFYPSYPLVSYDKEIQFIICPSYIEKEEIYRPVNNKKYGKNISRYKRKYRGPIREKYNRGEDEQKCVHPQVEVHYPVTLQNKLELFIRTKGIPETSEINSMDEGGHMDRKLSNIGFLNVQWLYFLYLIFHSEVFANHIISQASLYGN